jgi:hypothetical protein
VLSVRPQVVEAGALRRYTFAVAAVVGRRRTALRGVRVRFAGRTLTTRSRGRAVTVARLRRPGRYLARARVRGLAPATAVVRVQPRIPVSFTG